MHPYTNNHGLISLHTPKEDQKSLVYIRLNASIYQHVM